MALGLVNAYLKRCINKGFVKVSKAPARKYAYYLTPRGLAEKSRLTTEYLCYSFSLFRRARSAYSDAFDAAKEKGLSRLVFAGMSDLAEIATICALTAELEIVAIVDSKSRSPRFAGIPVFPSFDGLADNFDLVVVTDPDPTNAGGIYREAVERFGTEHAFLPAFLDGPLRPPSNGYMP